MFAWLGGVGWAQGQITLAPEPEAVPLLWLAASRMARQTDDVWGREGSAKALAPPCMVISGCVRFGGPAVGLRYT